MAEVGGTWFDMADEMAPGAVHDIGAGTVVGGRWRLTRFLGRGGFGRVFRATDTSPVDLGEAAVKILHPTTSPKEREEFLAEAKKVARMRHPHLVAYLDSGEHVLDGGARRAYLVTELCHHSLADRLTQLPHGHLDRPEVEGLVRDLADGLSHLHRRGLLHRDLKAANILASDEGWKLGDFGLTRNLTATGHYHVHGEHLDGGARGTPHYMAPELFTDAPAGPAADIYALGVTVHEALTGRRVYQAESQVGLIGLIASSAPTLDLSLDARWRRFVGFLVDRDPARRPSADQLVALLTQPPSQWGPPSPGPVPVLHPATPDRGHLPTAVTTGATPSSGPGARRAPLTTVAILAILLTAAVGGGLALLVSRGGDDGPPTEDLAVAPGLDPALTPDQQAEQIILTVADAPVGFDYFGRGLLSEEPLCPYVPLTSDLEPSQGSDLAAFVDPHRIYDAHVLVFADREAASRYLTISDSEFGTCSRPPVDEPGAEAAITLFDTVDLTIDGAAEVQSRGYSLRPGADAPSRFSVIGRVSNVVIIATGEDRDLTEHYAEVMVARAAARPEPTLQGDSTG